MSTAQSNYLDVVKNIEDFYTENAVTVYCPGSDVNLKFKPMSVKQLKRFIELQVATEKDEFGVIPGLKVIQYINNVLYENCLEKNADVIWSLLVVDRDAAVVQLRADVKSVAEVTIPQQSGEAEPETENIDLLLVVENIKSGKMAAKYKTRTKTLKFGTGSIKAKLSVPTIENDDAVNKHFVSKIKPKLQKGKKHVEKDVENILSQIYFLELCKYVDTITVTKDKEESIIDFTDHDKIDENMMLLEKLPTKLVSELSDFIGEVKEYKDSIFYYTNSEDKEIPLNVDAALFTGI